MKKTRFTEAQMVTILLEADAKPVPEVATKHGVSAQTIYPWRKHFGSLEPTDVKRRRQLEQEDGRLKKMVADRDLEIDVLNPRSEAIWKRAVRELLDHGLLEQRDNDGQVFAVTDEGYRLVDLLARLS